jgi:hypothetical protein
MPIFTIVFERRGLAASHDYQPLLRELQGQKCFPLWENAWLGSFENNATQVHNYFKRLLAEADRLAVCEMTNHFCYSGVVQGANQWLELNPPAGGLDGARSPAAEEPAKGPPAARKAAPAKPAAKKASAKPASQKPAAPAKAKVAATAAATGAKSAGGKQAPRNAPAKATKAAKRG